MNRIRPALWALALLLLIAVVRILASYSVTAETFDEPCHVSAAIELIQHGTYLLDPVNAPLARLGIGLPLFLSGARLPRYSAGDPEAQNYIDVGNRILNSGRGIDHNLTLARYGVLPFFVLSALVVFFWCRREFGDFAAIAAVFLFTTVPTILAFSGLAYADTAPSFAQPAALWAFAFWLENRSTKRALLVGAATGLAIIAKFTSLVYLPAGGISILLVRWLWRRRSADYKPLVEWRRIVLQMAVACLIAAFVIWGGYRFSVGHVQESMGISPATMPSFQHFPAPVRPLIRSIALKNPPLVAPGFFHGIGNAYTQNKEHPPSYFMGEVRRGGWWYFFMVDLALKSPPALLILSVIGMVALIMNREAKWTSLAPVAPIFAILLATTTTSIYYGVRHVIALFSLLAIVAGYGASYLWRVEGKRRIASRALLAVLLLWQIASSFSTGRDNLAYFNFLAGSDPSKIFVAGCDLDCGQDLTLLSRELHRRNISHVTLAVWTAADMSKTDLPAFDVARPFQPASGWFAISLRSLRAGAVFHETFPQNAFDWLKQYQPVARVGETILLYNIPNAMSPDSSAAH